MSTIEKTAKNAAKNAKPQAKPEAVIKPAPAPAPVQVVIESISIDGREFKADRINKAVASHLSDYGRAKSAIARFATNGRIGADLKALRLENAKAIREAHKAGAFASLVSDPAKFAKRAEILVRLTQALHDLEAL